MTELINNELDAKQLAGQMFRDGYNCAEAVLRTFCDKMQLDISDDALKMASSFGGGIGQAGCICGALTASIMAIGILQGRSQKDQSQVPVYLAAKEFHHIFTDNFGTACCRVLNPHPFKTKEHLRNCLKITGNTADLLMAFIKEKHLESAE